ncbi:type II toxin-antitoxin system VapC family toxin [Duganella callida]|uniref:Type II toxin-antitoxin system VapC family toxin n=2 Tax=Duganella callida TaxID=2561932 RepID=A0A4Y9SN15_9BURK|nr:type II toxin-antitoxin system VapC family toxin [Duganella callida]
MFLLDTNVVSELRKAPSGRADRSVVRWSLTIDETDLFLSSITIHELEIGILLLSRKDVRGGHSLRSWMQHDILTTYAGRILPVDTTIAQRSAALHICRTRPWADALIAATALVHGLTIVTRNVADFQSTGARLLNPWL